MEVIAGPSPKMVAVEAAIRLGASWVILDRSVIKIFEELEIVLLELCSTILIQPCLKCTLHIAQ